jgi:secreted trypsin-like serine protease
MTFLFFCTYSKIAAHCTSIPNLGRSSRVKYAKLGMNNRSQSDKFVFTYDIINIIKHPNYNARSKLNDIALLELNKNVKFTKYLYPICLPTSQPNNDQTIVTGFGQTGENHAVSEQLMKAIVSKFPYHQCKRILGNQIDPKAMLCFGNRTHSVDSCRVSQGII